MHRQKQTSFAATSTRRPSQGRIGPTTPASRKRYWDSQPSWRKRAIEAILAEDKKYNKN